MDAKPFVYDEGYLLRQSTTTEMAFLRLGWLLSALPPARLRNMRVLELGPGAGVVFETFSGFVREMHGYDIAPNVYCTCSPEEVEGGPWDLVLAYDVLEHFSDINDLWRIPFIYGCFSLPERPYEMFAGWRHLKPDEHLWHMRPIEFTDWALHHGYRTLQLGHPEDAIRTPWSDHEPNIMSFVIGKITAPAQSW